MKTWSKPTLSGNTTIPGGATNLNDLNDVVNTSPQIGDVLIYDGSNYSNTGTINGSNTDLINIDATNINAGILNYSRLPNLAGIVLSGDAVPPYISSITPITPNGPQEIEILGEYFSPITQLSIPGVNVVNLEVRSPNRIIANIDKSGLQGDIPIILSNGLNSNTVWPSGIKTVASGDPFFSDICLFLKGDGENNSLLILDSSSRPKSITRFGDTKISAVQSKYGGSSIYFDGAGDYLAGALTGQDTINIRLDPFTIEAWIYPLATNNLSIFNSSGHNFYPLQLFNGIWYCGDGINNNLEISNNIPPINTWTHMALTFDGILYKMYQNKVLIGQSANLLNNFSLTTFEVGARNSQNVYLNGYIDSLQVIKHCRSQEELDTTLQS